MSIIQGNAHTSAGGGGYQIERSLRFNSADSAYLNRTFTTPTNAKKFTISAWIKVTSPLGSSLDFGLLCGPNSAEVIGISGTGAFSAAVNGKLFIRFGDTNLVYYPQLFRDVSAWAHIVVAIDTDQAVQADRAKFYYNGVLQTATSSTITSGYSPALNTAATRYIGSLSTNAGYYANGYLAEYNFIDGQNLPSGATTWAEAFGKFNSNTGVWEPKAYSGSYGTNGFYLKFADNSGATSTTLGKDSSGNGNNWTPNNFSVTAGAGNDSLVDSPTSYGTDTGVGGEVRGNYATLNPLKRFTANATLSNGNLTASDGSTTSTSTIATMSLPASGKWYWEITVSASVTNAIFIGACPEANAYGTAVVQTNGSYRNNGTIYNTASVTQTSGATYTTNDVIGVAVDVDNGTVQFYKNGTAQGATPSFSFTALTVLVPFIATDNAAGTKTVNCNFGQRPFAYTAPSGFKALCTQNLPTPTIGATSTTQANDYFDVSLYTGTGSSLNITGLQFQPDFVWIKGRSGATDHGLYDAVRGVQKQLESNTTTAETTETTGLTAFNSDGFTVGALAQLNTSSATYVAWNWKANGAGSSNTAGTITSTVSANTTSGFSIGIYTGTGVNATVGHGLGVAPSMIIIKMRSSPGDQAVVYHSALGANKTLRLDSTGAAGTTTVTWQNTAPSTTVFSIGDVSENNLNNANGKNYVAYCFAPVAGYSAFGSYTGNGSTDGPFVYLGFRPRFLLLKISSTTGDWAIYDTSRNTYNVMDLYLYPNSSAAEGGSGTTRVDALSNGFKLRNSGQDNTSSATYIYAAFAETPAKFSLAR